MQQLKINLAPQTKAGALSTANLTFPAAEGYAKDPAVGNLLLVCERSVVYRPADGTAAEALRLPTQAERAQLDQRRAMLRQMLRPAAHDRQDLGRASAAVAEMVDAFTSTRGLPDRAGLVAGMVTDLQQFPAWAIETACRRVRLGEVQGLSLDFCPGSPRMAALIRDVLGPVGAEDRRIKGVLALVDRREVSGEEYGRVRAKFAALQDQLHAAEPVEPPRRTVMDEANERYFRRMCVEAGSPTFSVSPEFIRSNREWVDRVTAHRQSESEGT